ncbi:MAG: glycosyltransferase family 39 protein, partial [Candidatus Omnitrophica bacterium]|nr:glycosyltransferase family 39 protein [Candidatus Omnitrophota bacterium]
WINIFGISEFSLRLPSVLFNTATVILVFLIGKELFNKNIGIVATIFIGLSPFHLWYAQEARDYGMLLFWATLSSYFLFRAIREEKNKLWLFYVLSSVVSIYTNYFYILLFIAQCICLLYLKVYKLNFKEIIYILLIPFFFLPFLPVFLKKFYFVWQGFWVPKPTLHSFFITLENFMLGYNGTNVLYFIFDILIGVLFLSGILGLRRSVLRQSFILCLSLFCLPIIFAFCFSGLFFSIYLDRGLIICSPYYYLILSYGLINLKKIIRVPLFLILISILLICAWRFFNDFIFEPLSHHIGTYIKKPVRPIVRFLLDNVDLHQDVIAFTNVSTIPSINFYSQNKLTDYLYLFDPKYPDTTWQRPIRESKRNISIQRMSSLDFKRLWVISSDWARSGKLDPNSNSVKGWLDRNFRLESAKEFDGLWIFRYIK